MTNWIAKAYYWFWHDFQCRTEPYTYEFRRMAKKYPILWILFPAILIFVYFWKVASVRGKGYWLIGLIVTIFFTWLLLHLGGFA
jgi:hypothetical protein